MFVLGIDPGLARTGYAIVEDAARPKAVAAGVIRTHGGRPVAARLMELADDLEALLAEYRPAEAAIESVFANKNVQTITGVGRASGVAILCVARAAVPLFEYSPTAVKSTVAGFGGATKDQLARVVAMRLRLGTAPRPADAADALAVALCHLQASPVRRAVEATG